MPKRRTSLKDIASRLGVSVATVSRALHDSHEVSREMKEEVRSLAKELDYRPNPFARTLRSESPNVIGVLVPDLVTHYYAGVLDGIEEHAVREGYSVISCNSHESYEQEIKIIDNLIGMHVAGIIACLAQDTTDFSHYEKVGRVGVPLVFYARTCLPELFSSVTGDGDVAAYKATDHLIKLGSRRIAFIAGPNHLDMVIRRKHGYLEALKAHNIVIDPTLVSCGPLDYEGARQRALHLLLSPTPPDAILAFNNTVALAAFDAIKTLGQRIPADVAIIGFTDEAWPEYVTPTFSSIADQAHEQGVRAFDLLLRSLRGDTNIYKEVVPMALNIRESSAKHRD